MYQFLKSNISFAMYIILIVLKPKDEYLSYYMLASGTETGKEVEIFRIKKKQQLKESCKSAHISKILL